MIADNNLKWPDRWQIQLMLVFYQSLTSLASAQAAHLGFAPSQLCFRFWARLKKFDLSKVFGLKQRKEMLDLRREKLAITFQSVNFVFLWSLMEEVGYSSDHRRLKTLTCGEVDFKFWIRPPLWLFYANHLVTSFCISDPARTRLWEILF